MCLATTVSSRECRLESLLMRYREREIESEGTARQREIKNDRKREGVEDAVRSEERPISQAKSQAWSNNVYNRDTDMGCALANP